MRRQRRPSPQTAAVLSALADRGDEWSHGYELCTRLGLKAGTVYPILMRLADRGHVETAWERDPPRGRPPRHLYRLTPAGAELAAQVRSGAYMVLRAAVP
ncbi:MAG TPA: PadR family transcriptional regulator [Solirubrobacter sp.]|nr:PadR family transcriptional regulator [Solirubrobacter sp.]